MLFRSLLRRRLSERGFHGRLVLAPEIHFPGHDEGRQKGGGFFAAALTIVVGIDNAVIWVTRLPRPIIRLQRWQKLCAGDLNAAFRLDQRIARLLQVLVVRNRLVDQSI